MANFDTIVRGGTVATASDTFSCEIGIREGRIAALGDDLGTADEIIDAAGKLVLPGGIDSHVHISQPSGPDVVMADDFESATRSAANSPSARRFSPMPMSSAPACSTPSPTPNSNSRKSAAGCWWIWKSWRRTATR